ncbi:MAG: RodZ domain-containing protein [Nitriliruptoraceae bacterium]
MTTGIGDALRETREAHGRTIEDVARAIRARTEQLHALEEERFDTFSGDVYAKGFLRSYAIELGMDPEPLLEVYRSQVSSLIDIPASTLVTGTVPHGPRRSTPPGWFTWLLIGVVIVAGLGFLGTISTRFSPETANPDEPIGTPPAPAPQVEEDSDPEPTPVEPAPEPEPQFAGVEVILALEEASWLRVTVDGAVLIEQVVQAGETLQYQAEAEVILRVGNAGGVRVEVNGEDLGALGGRGQVAEVVYTRDELGPDATT